METINDIRREEGNPRSQPVGGKPRNIFRFFSPSTGPKLLFMSLIVLGLLLLLIGSLTWILPLVLAGLAIGIVAGLGYMWTKEHSLSATHP